MFSRICSRQFRQFVWLVLMLSPILACRTISMVERLVPTPEIIVQTSTISKDDAPPSAATLPTALPTILLPIITPTSEPTAVPTPPPTLRAPIRAPAKPSTPTRVPPAPTPSFEYRVSSAWCGPNWQTFVEGTVIRDGVPQNDLRVRVSLERDGSPIMNDYRTGTDATKPGGYTQIIDANAPRGGLWYLWIIDPQSQKRISEIAAIKTDSQRVEEISCQSALINFAKE
ncbi:MAG: hypothetical protein HY868_21700 [Chloroflexi bacterium]|nr:hypothetical protein [Chloroflexota bacterium]